MVFNLSKIKKNKKGALELSIGTIVILVLAMSMLILGLVLVKTIFSGAKYNVDQMNNKVRDEINKLFVEDQKIVVYLANNEAEIKQGNDWGVAFMVQNLIKGTAEETRFTYETKFQEADCKSIRERDAMNFLRLGKEGQLRIAPGDSDGEIIRFAIPEGAPLCMVRYRITVKADGAIYTSESFDVRVMPA